MNVGKMEYWNDGVVHLFQSVSNQNNLYCAGLFTNNRFHVELVAVGCWGQVVGYSSQLFIMIVSRETGFN